ncbi:MAG: helix-turn-helix domain-containing protein [Carbonactinosporaceae bacterium]
MSEHENELPTLLYGGWLTTEHLARLLGRDASTVRRWRTQKPVQGPPFVQLSGRVTMYSAMDVERWLRNARVDPGEVA